MITEQNIFTQDDLNSLSYVEMIARNLEPEDLIKLILEKHRSLLILKKWAETLTEAILDESDYDYSQEF